MLRNLPSDLQMVTAPKSRGFAHMREMIRAARDGRPPAAETVQAVAEAFAAFFQGGPQLEEDKRRTRNELDEFAKRLGIGRKQGNVRTLTAGEAAPQRGAVGYVIQRERRLVADGLTPRKARAAALKSVGEEFGIARSTLQRWMQQHGACAAREIDRILAEILPTD